MIVFGGSDDNSGGKYNPLTDTWIATSTTNAPSARSYHSAVWTGSEMIIWGGAFSDVLNTGGRYNPTTNTWTPISTSNAPSARFGHTAVWTGTEMIVWGGKSSYNSNDLLNTGGRYNPATNTWAPISTANAPTARILHTSVWTGTEMIVWGGTNDSTGLFPGSYQLDLALNSGGRYNFATNTWTPTNTSNAPPERYFHTAVWTGAEMIVWGGRSSYYGTYNTGAHYNSVTDTWATISLTNAPPPRSNHTAIWTGDEMIVCGGVFGSNFTAYGGKRYNLSTDKWLSLLENDPPPIARSGHTAVWTGKEMIIWGGFLDTGRILAPAETKTYYLFKKN